MNVNHVRPMLAFWLLAAVAAVVTGLGLHEGGSGVTVRAGSPSPVTRTDASPLVLGGTLRAVPGALGTPTPTSTLPSVTELRDAAQKESAGGAVSTSAKTGATTTTRTRASSTPKTSTRPRSGGSTSGTTGSTTATATTSPTGPGPGQGAGNGRGSRHGAGNGVGQGPASGNPGRGH